MVGCGDRQMEIAQEIPFSKDEFISKISRLIKAYGYASFICDKHIRETDVSPNDNTIRMAHEQVAIDFARSEGFSVSYKHNSYGVRYIVFTLGDTNVFYPSIKENRPWDIEEMDWYDLRAHANTMSDFIQKLYNYI